jgi:hypothetical protein
MVYIAQSGKMYSIWGSAYRRLVENPEEKSRLGETGCRREDYIKIDRKEI